MSLFDSPVHMVMFVMFCVILFAAYVALQAIYGVFANIPIANNGYTIGSQTINPYNQVKAVGNIILNFDIWAPLIFFVISITIIALGALLNSNPIGWGIGAIMIVFLIYFATFLSNVTHNIATNPSLLQGANAFPKTLAILAQLPLYEIVFLFIYLIIIAVRVKFYSPQTTTGIGGFG
jgi:hypothetical protein